MTKAIELIPLSCVQCNYPIPAEDQQVAWVCSQCSTGMILEEQGLEKMDFHYHQGIRSGQTGKPFWVLNARVNLDRKVYNTFGKKDKDAKAFWGQDRMFFLPAYDCSVEEMVEIGKAYLRNPLQLADGESAAHLPVTMGKEDIKSIAEYLVMAIEADRRDDVKQVTFQISLSDPVLWILP